MIVTLVLPKATLPTPADGFDDPARLRAFLDAVRWGAIASADACVLQAPFRSGITIEDYLFLPESRERGTRFVDRAVLAGLLSGDDVHYFPASR